MPKVPENPPPLPKKKYHYSTEPKIRISKKVLVNAMWDSRVVTARFSYRRVHLLVGDKTLCGIEEYRTAALTNSWEENKLFQCYRCRSTNQKIMAYYSATSGDTKDSEEGESE